MVTDTKNEIINMIGLKTVDYIQGRPGKYQAITWNKYTGMGLNNHPYAKNASDVLRAYKKDVLQSIIFIPDTHDHPFTVFSRKGKKIMTIDVELINHPMIKQWLNLV